MCSSRQVDRQILLPYKEEGVKPLEEEGAGPLFAPS
jgi:hypothetical protein